MVNAVKCAALFKCKCDSHCSASAGVPINRKRVVSAGISAGGFSAGQYAANNIYSGLRWASCTFRINRLVSIIGHSWYSTVAAVVKVAAAMATAATLKCWWGCRCADACSDQLYPLHYHLREILSALTADSRMPWHCTRNLI
jgi:hypothetical protein